MLCISQVICPIHYTEEDLFAALCRKLKCRKEDILSWEIARRSIDARKKPVLFYSFTLLAECRDEGKICKRLKKDRDVTKEEMAQSRAPESGRASGNLLEKRPVIVGTGPAGLFCGLTLARAGFCPILLERGRDVDRRSADVEAFWSGGALNENSNVQFGEGGAGTFSDGKLNTLVKDKYGRNRRVLETFVAFGAKEDILYDQKPHLGTDVLKEIVKNMRQEMIRLGGEVRFESQVTDLRLSGAGRRITAVEIGGVEWLETDLLVLAIGHSARDTFAMLHEKGLRMEAKPFAVGFRVQHPQRFIDESQYGTWENASMLGAAAYKLTAKTEDGRGVYTFCMCPGGYVVDASSEKGHLAVNGMSYSGRDGENANSAVIVAVPPDDYGAADSPLSGIAFQRELEKRAHQAGGGSIPVQKFRDFQAQLVKQGILKDNICLDLFPPFEPAIKGKFREADLAHILPPALNVSFVEGMGEMDRKLRGFASGEVWLCGVESRTSSPIRICRDETFEGSISGIYPCGEGAGYAGGITSAAMDGIRVAEAITLRYVAARYVAARCYV